MSGKRLALGALAALWIAGCGQPAPKIVDKTPPKIVLTALGAPGNPVFASDENGEPNDGCAKFRSFPGRWAMSVGDSGGVAVATVRVVAGRIVKESVIIAPDTPESSWSITPAEGLSEVLMIRLQPPRPGVVRTGLLAMFSIAPRSRSASIVATAWDFANNVEHLYQVDTRLSDDPVGCR
ncbi:MAG TPA: hypothetical protein VL754_12790 [Verrucomicrobiae bacterium]|jgi:hypothetical protein|nr:hypothetical protein [Verrucomicrobiae bacterium]